MKSKIDEVIEDIETIAYREKYTDNRVVSMDSVLEFLEQLRPYVEFYDNLKLRGITIKWQEYRIERNIADNLIQQIKEQRDEKHN